MLFIQLILQRNSFDNEYAEEVIGQGLPRSLLCKALHHV